MEDQPDLTSKSVKKTIEAGKDHIPKKLSLSYLVSNQFTATKDI